MRINQVLDQDDSHYLSINNSTTMASEHLPLGAGKFDSFPQSGSKLSVLEGDAQIDIIKNKSDLVEAQIDVKDSAIIRFNQIYFPSWNYYLNSAQIKPVIDSKYPLPQLKLNQGNYTFKAQFNSTPTRQMADIISFASLSILASIIIYEPIRRFSHFQRRKKS